MTVTSLKSPYCSTPNHISRVRSHSLSGFRAGLYARWARLLYALAGDDQSKYEVRTAA